MKLVHKLLLGYFLIITIIGTFSTIILMHTVDESSTNLNVYREREITSFVKVLNANIIDGKNLKNTKEIQELFESTINRLPHIKRLTLHKQDKKTSQYTHIASTDKDVLHTPSHREDIDAIIKNETTILYEIGKDGERWIDITYPITNKNAKAIAALGAAVSLSESDEILNKAIELMKDEALDSVFMAILLSIVLSLIFGLIIVRKIVSPIEKLKTAVSSFSKKELTHNIEVHSNDEIGKLSHAFNTMAFELNMLYTSMEEQIDAKTKELETQFLTDSLTGMPNRQALFKEIKRLDEFHIAILDISSFKDINDSYGVDIGNRVLQMLSKKIKIFLHDSPVNMFRLGADEVALINPMILDEHEFKESIKYLIKSIEHDTLYFEEEDIEINISLHAGISFEHNHSIEKANIALVNAKKEHVDLVIFDKKIDSENRQVQNLETIIKIKNAIENFDFISYYQPIVDKDKKIIKYESLVRMKDNKEILSPYFFLDIAKKTKYYQHITRTMISQSFKEFEDRDTSFSINIEADDIINKDTLNFIKKHLEEFKNPERVIFELVESQDVHDLPNIKEFINFVKNHGAKIAIDDFGTGYSNFSYLMDLEPDYLKIDGSLIKNIDIDIKSYNIVKTLINFAHNLGILVIAEYIHSKEVLAVCEELGVDEFQGYLFGEPSLKLKD